MSDPNFNVEYRLSDSDNNILRKLLNNIRNVITGAATFSVTQTVPSGAPTVAATFTEATKTVAATGTPEALGTGTFRQVFIYPLRTNTGAAFWGTVSTNDTQHGSLPVVIAAPAGEGVNIAQIFVDVAVNGEGVRYVGVN